ncbi:hypothetical protein [Halorubrum sp. SD626R]|uniref:hypothetical protein n=1 Tax=Halorubrum sp. SD626R TaxID=1419722 RepID=UPI000AAE73C1|nr:hypothetical protein [Halorubrum sp. SD626R]TKX79762.1 hypothetical protein EXE53_14155 [Halorubrum sp. SD626R]
MTTSRDAGVSEAETGATDYRLLDRLRRPEYTGENRCLPCTGVNVAIAAAGATAVGAVGGPLLGTAGFGAALAAIWLRGYLVPGTPELTKRYLPERVLRLFGKGRATAPPSDVDAESYLLSADVLAETSDGTDLAFAPWFASAWRAALDGMRLDATVVGEAAADSDGTDDSDPGADIVALASLTGVDAESLSLDWRGGTAFAFADGDRIGHWESRAAFLADVAADRALTDRLDDWRALPLATRSGVLGALRLFVEECPACEGPVSLEERVVESCCSSYDVIAGRCAACDARLFETDLPPSLAAE